MPSAFTGNPPTQVLKVNIKAFPPTTGAYLNSIDIFLEEKHLKMVNFDTIKDIFTSAQ